MSETAMYTLRSLLIEPQARLFILIFTTQE